MNRELTHSRPLARASTELRGCRLSREPGRVHLPGNGMFPESIRIDFGGRSSREWSQNAISRTMINEPSRPAFLLRKLVQNLCNSMRLPNIYQGERMPPRAHSTWPEL